MATAIIQHRIEDFAAWKPVYDAHEGRKQYSFQDRVLQMIDDPNNVIVILDSDSADRLRACLTRSSSHAVVSRSIILSKTFVRVLDPVCRAGSHTRLKIM
jgi:hypothetical protein